MDGFIVDNYIVYFILYSERPSNVINVMLSWPGRNHFRCESLWSHVAGGRRLTAMSRPLSPPSRAPISMGHGSTSVSIHKRSFLKTLLCRNRCRTIPRKCPFAPERGELNSAWPDRDLWFVSCLSGLC